jgi:hypothetical protein
MRAKTTPLSKKSEDSGQLKKNMLLAFSFAALNFPITI